MSSTASMPLPPVGIARAQQSNAGLQGAPVQAVQSRVLHGHEAPLAGLRGRTLRKLVWAGGAPQLDRPLRRLHLQALAVLPPRALRHQRQPCTAPPRAAQLPLPRFPHAPRPGRPVAHAMQLATCVRLPLEPRLMPAVASRHSPSAMPCSGTQNSSAHFQRTLCATACQVVRLRAMHVHACEAAHRGPESRPGALQLPTCGECPRAEW